MTTEGEFCHLGQWLTKGDWVLDIGANIGHYSLRFSELVGSTGRVIAIEPVPETFALLAANVALVSNQNVTLLNVAVSDSPKLLGMTIPTFQTGLPNYYQAHLTHCNPAFNVLCLSIDSLTLPHCIKLVKIDSEGHEFSVLRGMQHLLQRDHPTLIVEGDSPEVVSYLKAFGYSYEKHIGSPNLVFRQVRHKPALTLSGNPS